MGKNNEDLFLTYNGQWHSFSATRYFIKKTYNPDGQNNMQSSLQFQDYIHLMVSIQHIYVRILCDTYKT